MGTNLGGVIRWALLLGVWCGPVHADGEHIRTTVEFMASLGSRISGYPGSEKAAAFVARELQQSGVADVTWDEFLVTVPIDRGGELVLEKSGERFELRGLWPNLVRTPTLPPEGLSAPMIYGGSGEFAQFNGKELDGRVVLLEFNSWNHWLRAAALGARAMLFIEPAHSTGSQAAEKFVQAPLDVPRFWIGRQVGQHLREQLGAGELRVHLKARMDWEQRPTWNIWGIIPGKDPRLEQEIVVVEAYYDGISVVPALAPSAETAGSIAALLELARHLQAHPPGRTIVLAATAAHFQAQRGIIDFLDRHARTHDYYSRRMEHALKPKLFISLDLSSGTDQLGIWNNTSSYELKRFFVPFGRKLTAYAAQVASQQGREAERALVNGISPIKGMGWSTFVPGGLSANGIKALEAGLVCLTFATVNDARFVIDTPLDLAERVDYKNLERQITFLNALLSRAFSDPHFLEGVEDFGTVLKDELRSLKVEVRTFPRRSQVPDRPVVDAVVVLGMGRGKSQRSVEAKSHKGVRWTRYHRTDVGGNVEVQGLPLGGISVEAYVVEPETGRISYAPDLSGRAQDFRGEQASAIRWQTNEKMVVVFPCVSRAFYNLIDPRFLKPLRQVAVLDHNGMGPRQYGLALGAGVQEPVGVVFGVQDAGLKLLMGQRMMLINSQGGSSEDQARGTGYALAREALVPTGLLAARDMWRLNDARLQTMRTHAIENQRLVQLHQRGREFIEKAAAAAAERQWDRYVAHVRAALGVTSRAYPDVLGTLNDVIQGMVFFLALVIPAAFFGERLLFAATHIHWQLAGFGALLLLIWMVISQIHPAFSIAHPLVILLAFAIMAMAFFVLFLGLGRFNRYMKQSRLHASHVHETDISRVSASYAAFALGISNMRRRKLRTGLTLLTLTLLTFTVLSFTSFEEEIRFMAFPLPHIGTYEGVLIRDRGWDELSPPTLDYARSHFGEDGLVSPRNWYISTDAEEKQYLEIRYGKTAVKAVALLGLAPQESRITGVGQTLKKGSFFARADESTCLLSEEMAATLGLGPEEVGKAQIHLFGRPLVVRGIVDSKALAQIRDLDGESLTPVDFQVSNTRLAGADAQIEMGVVDEEAALEFRASIHLSPEDLLIVPYGILQEAGGTLRSVAVKFGQASAGKILTEEFLLHLSLTLFAGLRSAEEEAIRVFSYTSIGMTSVEGLVVLLVPMFIAAMIVLNVMMGAVYERFGEIGIYSSVGLTPLHIALLFIAEACVYAVVGTTLGYILGQGLGKLLLRLDLLEGMSLNYSSMSAVLSSLLVMLVVLLSTAYPAWMAARTAVPDTVRRWTPPPPLGERWEFEFPFMVSEAETLGLCGFLANYFNAYSEESIGTFYAEKVGIVSVEGRAGREYAVQLLLWLAPFDVGVSQYLQLEFLPTATSGLYCIQIFIQRISGQDTFWRRINHRFMNRLRQEFLIWHTLNPAAKTHYRQRAEQVLNAEV